MPPRKMKVASHFGKLEDGTDKEVPTFFVYGKRSERDLAHFSECRGGWAGRRLYRRCSDVCVQVYAVGI